MTWHCLGQVLSPQMETYPRNPQIQLRVLRDDHCMSSSVDLHLHNGTHLDLPRHFVGKAGLTAEQLDLSKLHFQKIAVISFKELDQQLSDGTLEPACDLLILRGRGEQRQNAEGMQCWPHLSGEQAEMIVRRLPHLRVVATDCLSFSSPDDRAAGHRVHQVFLGKGVFLLEDLPLKVIPQDARAIEALLAPIRIEGAEACPSVLWLRTD